MVNCHSCGQSFENFGELALHIASSRKGHRQGKVWAAKYLVGKVKRDMPQRSPMTEEERENRAANLEESRRQVSGREKIEQTVCPLCKSFSRQSLPVEYVGSLQAWRNDKGLVVVCCEGCRK
jgi:hypothetical protein